MASLEDDVEKEERHIHPDKTFSNPVIWMLIFGSLACLEESVRSAGYLLIGGEF